MTRKEDNKEKKAKQEEKRRRVSSAGAPSKVISTKFMEMEGAEETEIAAQITVPTDGGWGWVVLMCAFGCAFILDGCVFSFGALLKDISKDLQVSDATTAIVGSLQFSMYLMLSPIASAFINRFGFRVCGMVGSIICCYSALGSSLAKGIASFFFLYGFCYGIGGCFVNMAAGLVTGFYFEKYRTMAMIFVSAGSSFGIMLLFPVNLVLSNAAGWRSTVLLHSGFLGLIFFLALTFKPLLSLTVTKVEEAVDEPTRTVTFLPTVVGPKKSVSNQAQGNTTERLFHAVSNARFPTAAAVIQDETVTTIAGPSQKPAVSRITLSYSQGVSKAQLNQVKSMISRGAVHDQPPVDIDIKLVESERKKSCWGRLCDWDTHSPTARPMYRDDAFYDGKIQNLPQYQKSVADAGDTQTGLEYQMAVSRAITVNDMQDQRGVFTTAVRRVLVTMCDVELLKKKSFIIYSLSGAAGYMGFNIPYVFLQDRNLVAGVDATHCTYFVSVIGFANAFGRMIWSIIAIKVSPLYLYIVGCCLSGVSTVVSGLSYHVIYQYFYSFVFGFNVCVTNCMRSLIIVDLYGLERLTNGTGLLLLFMGVGNLFGTPIASVLKDVVNYDAAFYFSGGLLILASIFGIFVRVVERSEKKSAPEARKSRDTPETTGKLKIPKDLKLKSEGISSLTLPNQKDSTVLMQHIPLTQPTEAMQPTQVNQPTSVTQPVALVTRLTSEMQPAIVIQSPLVTQSVPIMQPAPVTHLTSVSQPMPSTSKPSTL